MADLADVETKLLALVGSIVYPNGTGQPSIIASPVKLFRGWPIAAQLDADMAASVANVSIFSQPNVERNTTRYPRDDQEASITPATITATVAGNQITLGGTVATPQNVIVLLGVRLFFNYAVQANDTLASIAIAVAALIAAQYPGTAAVGPKVTVLGFGGALTARIVAQGQVWTEQGRQERGIMVTCWCPTPGIRDALAPPIDLGLKKLDFITLADNSAARLRYERTNVSDEAQKVQIYRRDLFFMLEYATASLDTVPQVGVLQSKTNQLSTVV